MTEMNSFFFDYSGEHYRSNDFHRSEDEDACAVIGRNQEMIQLKSAIENRLS